MPGKTWPLWSWVEAAALPVLGALVWSTWAGLPIAAVFDFVSEHHAAPSSGAVIGLLLLGGTLAARLTRPWPGARWLLVLGGFAAVLAAEWGWLYRADYAPWDARWLGSLAQQTAHAGLAPILAALLAAVLWRYGLTARWDDHDEFARAFAVGVLALGLGLAWAAAFAPAGAGRLVIAAGEFVVVAWAGLSLAGVAGASRAATGTVPRLNRNWLLAVLTVVGAIFALGLLLTSWLNPQLLAGVGPLLQALVDAIRTIVLVVLFVLSYILFWALMPLFDLIRRLMGNNLQLLPPLNPLLNQKPAQPEAATVLPPALAFVLQALVIVVLLLIVGYVLAWAIRRQTTTDAAGVSEDRELILSWDLLRAQLAGLLARRPASGLFPALAGDPQDPILRLRQAYRRVLAQALARGQARQPQQTPRGYLPALDELWPAEAEALASLTAAYGAARYGQVPPTAEQLASLQPALDRIAQPAPGQPAARAQHP